MLRVARCARSDTTACGRRARTGLALGGTGSTVTTRLAIRQLQFNDLSELANHLCHPDVYEHIGSVPSPQDFILHRENALRGPGSEASGERWLNFLVREASSHRMLGCLEATLHDDVAEVAFLFSPQHWGKGLAGEALHWLQNEIATSHGVTSFWATTVPENHRCQALLHRAGYTLVQGGGPALYSYDAGDLVFHLQSAV